MGQVKNFYKPLILLDFIIQSVKGIYMCGTVSETGEKFKKTSKKNSVLSEIILAKKQVANYLSWKAPTYMNLTNPQNKLQNVK